MSLATPTLNDDRVIRRYSEAKCVEKFVFLQYCHAAGKMNRFGTSIGF